MFLSKFCLNNYLSLLHLDMHGLNKQVIMGVFFNTTLCQRLILATDLKNHLILKKMKLIIFLSFSLHLKDMGEQADNIWEKLHEDSAGF